MAEVVAFGSAVKELCLSEHHKAGLAAATGLNKATSARIIRELRNKGVKKFAYVTQNQDLITQIKKDLAPYGVDDVQFVTYSKMDANVKDGILIFDREL